MEIQAVIWDMDGTLLDTEPCYMEAEGSIVKRCVGGDIAEVTHALLGKTENDSANIVINHFKLPISKEEYLKERYINLMRLLPNAQVLPGVWELVNEFELRGIRQGVATSSPKHLLELKRNAHPDLFNRFQTVVCGDDVKNGKPDPEIFLLTAQNLDVAPENCLVFEDAPVLIIYGNLFKVLINQMSVEFSLFANFSSISTFLCHLL
uniref:Uncharacterized protein n=1 Tax=Timspurckia oligopyrenoides TaxID=708627 RepID=A0A7S0ZCS1_9RHOD|mmetsp:Transcript_12780/g.22980  ORF Transcript_12780/g.22980 Transcript_12780/m.22980 type:complete len:207 (+) Transcript_12780:88-708(+)